MLAIGLISGTSVDGIDAALVDLAPDGREVDLLAFVEVPYPSRLREELLAVAEPGCGSVDQICRLNVEVGRAFGQAALAVCEAGGKSSDAVAFVGSHGQTIHHMPHSVSGDGSAFGATLQIGDAATIAEMTGVTVVSDFRSADMAAGGQGAPLVPLVDFLLFSHASEGRVMLNLGGIANLTALAPSGDRSDVFAFDTGPANMVIDAVVAHVTDGRERFDRDGRMASGGVVSDGLLAVLLEEAFFAQAPPKSTGREQFGAGFLSRVWEAAGQMAPNDLVATVTRLTVESVAQAIENFVRPVFAPDAVYVSGGGARNTAVMDGLSELLAGVEIHPIEHLDVPSEAKEAIAFAVLAGETMAGRPGNVPRVTGARRPVVLGSVVGGSSQH